jgi:hypothetical protein
MVKLAQHKNPRKFMEFVTFFAFGVIRTFRGTLLIAAKSVCSGSNNAKIGQQNGRRLICLINDAKVNAAVAGSR